MSSDPQNRHKRLQVLYITLTLIFAAALRFYGLGDQSLWGDEVRSVERSQMILEEGFRSGLFLGHGPLYFYALVPFLSAAVNEWVLRLPSVLFGVALTLLAYFLGREFLNRDHALLAAVFAACSPFSVYYSQEVRYISLFILFCALSMLLMLRYSESGSTGLLIAYLVTTLLALFSFVGGVFILLGQNIWFVFARSNRSRLVRWLLCQVVIVAVFVPWSVRAYHLDINPFRTASPESVSVSALKAGNYRPVQPTHLGYALFAFTVGFSLGPSNRDLQEDPNLSRVLDDASTVIPAVLIFGALVVAGVYHSFSLSRKKASLLLLCLLAPLLCAYLLTSISRIAFNVRYTTAAFPAYIVLLTAGATWWWKRRWSGRVLLLAAAGIAAFSLVNYYHNPRYAKEDNRGAAAIIARHRQAEEPLIVGVPLHAFAYYYPDPFTPWKDVSLETSGSEGDRREIADAERIWIAASRTWENRMFKEFLRKMQDCYRVERRYDLAGYQVLSFDTDTEGMTSPCLLRDNS